MKNKIAVVAILCFAFSLFSCSQEQNQSTPSLRGLLEPAEVIRDTMGVNHIYAKNEHDLFFLQGYHAAKDRLFQFEIWRRQATGTVAEILGPRELKRDIGTRLFKFRGDLHKEFGRYHAHGEEIILAFTEGINACIDEVQGDTSLLPLEFRLLGIVPKRWTPDIVISRHQGLLGNLPEEIATARAVGAIGAEKVKEAHAYQPGDPDITLDPSISNENLLDSVTELYSAYRKPLRFQPEDLIAAANPDLAGFNLLARQDESDYQQIMASELQSIGSNNWIVSGLHTQSGLPMLANDPHRAIVVPSLRYMVHLQAPGWDVVGAGEPTIPGVSIGHNNDGAWGLTIFAIDGEDLYVYELNPQNLNQYKYQGNWEDMRSIRDTIHVRGVEDVFVEHKFTRHGPVTMVDSVSNTAYAVRCAWLEPGGAPYLASLRIDQAKTWDEFREACSYSYIPGENMIWADKTGNIGWQAVGVAPIRKNWSGLVPVPGDGRFEWAGYLPIQSLPHTFNPPKGFFATANENNVPPKYEHRDAVAWMWADPFRVNRINEVLASARKHSQADLMSLQFDYLSIPARTLVRLLQNLKSPDAKSEAARLQLLQWDFILDRNSVAAGIYVAWEKKISAGLLTKVVPEQARKFIRALPLSKVLRYVTTADKLFGRNPGKARDQFLLACLGDALTDLETKLGPDQAHWQYGQPAYHHVLIKHPLSNAVDEHTRKRLEFGPRPRGGYGATPGMTTNNNNQGTGASFRMVVDVADWDKTMFTNTPGQSGDPASPYYGNLFDLWANDRHFPVYFTRAKVEQSASETVRLRP